ncbi:MAG: hypothetical protein WHT06_12215 [Desulfobacterales bacterium]
MLVDVDGTPAGVYRNGRRPARPPAVEALRLLAGHAPVFLWSIAGEENGRRVIKEYPEIRPYVSGGFGQREFAFAKVGRVYGSMMTATMCWRGVIFSCS